MPQRVRTTALSPLFRSASQAEILALLFTSGAELTVTQIAAAIERDRSQTARDVGKLAQAGILATRAAGRTRFVTANTSSPIHDAVEKIILHTYGPQYVIAAALADVAGVSEALIFGSWAARYHGEPGRPPGDIDVIVVGSADPDDVWEASTEAARRLGREVNARVVSHDRWSDDSDQFLVGVRTLPLVRLDLHAVRAAA